MKEQIQVSQLMVMVFNVIFNNISVKSWWTVLMVEKITDLSQVTDKRIGYTSPERDSNSRR